MKKKYLVSFAVGALCLYLAFRKVAWAEIGQAFLQADYAILPLFVVGHLASMGMRVVRWRLILGPVKKVGYRSLLSAAGIGFMANFVFPARAGELIRAYLIGRREGISKSSSFATIVLERLFDGFAILLFLGLFKFFAEVPPGKEKIMEDVQAASLVALAAYLAIMGTLVFFRHRPGAFAAAAGWACRPLPRRMAGPVSNLVASFGGGLAMLGNPGHVLAVAGWSVLLWLTQGLCNNIVLAAFNLKLPFYAGLFLLVVQSFGVMVPSPGFVGAFQYAHVLGLALFGVSKELALSVGILLHGLLFLTYIGLGLVLLWSEGLGLGDVQDKAAEAGGPEPPCPPAAAAG